MTKDRKTGKTISEVAAGNAPSDNDQADIQPLRANSPIPHTHTPHSLQDPKPSRPTPQDQLLPINVQDRINPQERYSLQTPQDRHSTQVSQEQFHPQTPQDRHSAQVCQEQFHSQISQDRHSAQVSQEQFHSQISQDRHSAQVSQDRSRPQLPPDRHSTPCPPSHSNPIRPLRQESILEETQDDLKIADKIARIESFISALGHSELIYMMDLRGLNVKRSMEVLIDGMIRYEIRKKIEPCLAERNEENDLRKSEMPFTMGAGHFEPSVDEDLVQPGRLLRNAEMRQSSPKSNEQSPAGASAKKQTGNQPVKVALSLVKRAIPGESPSGPAPSGPNPIPSEMNPPCCQESLPSFRTTNPPPVRTETRNLRGNPQNQNSQDQTYQDLPCQDFHPQDHFRSRHDPLRYQDPYYGSSQDQPRESYPTTTRFPQESPYYPRPHHPMENTSLNPFRANRNESSWQEIKQVAKLGNQVLKMGLGFEGKLGEDVEAFLENFADAIEALSIREEEALKIIPMLLRGLARNWYHVAKDEIHHYTDFLHEFRAVFSAVDWQSRIWDAFRKNRQETNESISQYVTKMRILFSRLDTPFPIPHQLDLIYRNLNPKYILLMDPGKMRTYEEFLQQGKQVEYKLICTEQYGRMMEKPSPAKRSNQPSGRLLAIEDWIGGKANEQNENCVVGSQARKTKVASTKTQKAPVVQFTRFLRPLVQQRKMDGSEMAKGQCFNCGKTGHFIRECPEPGKLNLGTVSASTDRYPYPLKVLKDQSSEANFSVQNDTPIPAPRTVRERITRGATTPSVQNGSTTSPLQESIPSSHLQNPHQDKLIKDNPSWLEAIEDPKERTRNYSDGRLFLIVKIKNKEFEALVDSGANRTFVGPAVVNLVKDQIIPINQQMIVADGQAINLLGMLDVRVTWPQGHCDLMVNVAPALIEDVVVGMDLIQAAEINIFGKYAMVWIRGTKPEDDPPRIEFEIKEPVIAIAREAEEAIPTTRMPELRPNPNVRLGTKSPSPQPSTSRAAQPLIHRVARKSTPRETKTVSQSPRKALYQPKAKPLPSPVQKAKRPSTSLSAKSGQPKKSRATPPPARKSNPSGVVPNPFAVTRAIPVSAEFTIPQLTPAPAKDLVSTEELVRRVTEVVLSALGSRVAPESAAKPPTPSQPSLSRSSYTSVAKTPATPCGSRSPQRSDHRAPSPTIPPSSHIPSLMDLRITAPPRLAARYKDPNPRPIKSKELVRPTVVPNMQLHGRGACWNCGGRGHHHRECPTPRQQVYCFLCGHPGVRVGQCPQCGDIWNNNRRD